MSTHARDTDRSTSHDAIDPDSLEIAVHREKVRLIHRMHMDTGLIDDVLGFYYGPSKDREHSKRRADITVGSKALCEKSLVAAEDCPAWTGETSRISPNSGREQKVWGFCKCPGQACMAKTPKLTLREEVIMLRKENAALRAQLAQTPFASFTG
jgi:hypothetical protein